MPSSSPRSGSTNSSTSTSVNSGSTSTSSTSDGKAKKKEAEQLCSPLPPFFVAQHKIPKRRVIKDEEMGTSFELATRLELSEDATFVTANELLQALFEALQTETLDGK